MKKIFLSIVFCFVGYSIDAMMEPVDEGDLTRANIADLEMGGYESTQDEGSEGLMPDEVTILIYEKKDIDDKYERAHLRLMVQELYETDNARYHELVSEVMPTRRHHHQQNTEEIDKLYGGLMQIKHNLHTTNQLLQQQIDGDDEQARIDTYRWRCDCLRECCFGVAGLVVGILGTSIVASLIK